MPIYQDIPVARFQRRLYQCVVVTLFLVIMGVIMGILSPGQADTDLDVVGTGVHLPMVLVEVAIYAFLFLNVARRPRRYLKTLTQLGTLLPVLLVCVASVFWSTNSDLTIRRAMMLVMTSLVGIVLSTDFTLTELVQMFSFAALIHIVCVGGLMVVSRGILYSPSDPTALKGLTTHKNVFGQEMALACLTFALVPFDRARWSRWPLTLIAFLFLLLSHSTGSLVSLMGGLAVIPFVLPMRRTGPERLPLMLGSLLLLLLSSALVYANLGLIPMLLSKDATLTGRTDLWELVRVAISYHPLFGYGYEAFWQGLQGTSSSIIRQVGWLVPNAHNGYYDLLLGIGYVGALCLVPMVLQSIVRSVRFVARERRSVGYLPIAFLIFWFIYNFNESALLSRGSLLYLLFIIISTSLAIESRAAVALPQRHAAPGIGTTAAARYSATARYS